MILQHLLFGYLILLHKKEILKQIIENSILKVKNGSKDPFQTLEKYDFWWHILTKFGR